MASASDIVSFGESQVQQISSTALDALQQLQDAALGVAFSTVNYVEVMVHNPAAMPSIDVSSIPSVSSITQAFNSILPDSFPAYPDQGSVAQYRNYMWQGSQLATITVAIDAYLQSLGMPSTTYQDAIYDADKERKLRTMNDAVDLVQAKTSALGYKYAQLQTNAAILDIVEKYQFDLENQTRTITQQMTEWARQAYQFSIQQGLESEKAQMQFSLQFGGLFLEYFIKTFTAILEKYKGFVEVQALKFKAIIDDILATTQILKANAEIIESEEKLLYERDRLNIEQAITVFKGNIEQAADSAREQIAAGTATAQTAGELIKAIGVNTINLVSSTGT